MLSAAPIEAERLVCFTDQFFDRLGLLLPDERGADGTPSVTDFLAAFQPRIRGPPPSVLSQNTELTESSGVSSLLPKRSGKVLAAAAAATRTETLKRKPFLEPEPARQTKKRQVLKERN